MDLIKLWEPQPRQAMALACPYEEILFGGARGGGKSDMLLAKFIKHWEINRGNARGIIFRKSYPELEEIQGRAMELYAPIGARWHEQKKTFVFPGGGYLRLRFIENLKDATKYQGHSYTYIGIDEAGNWETPEPLDLLRACLRSAQAIYDKAYVLTANPGGPGHNWIKSRYIDQAKPMQPFPVRNQKGEILSTAVFIPSRIQDNQILLRNDPGYINRLKMVGNETMVRAWLEGDWDIVAGGMIDDLWKREIHVIDPFVVPYSWHVERSFDWGSSKPFSVGWWARSDGSTAPNGRVHPKGTLFRVAEWYGWTGKPNEGCGILPGEIAKGIKERESQLRQTGGILSQSPPRNGPADPSIFDDSTGVSIAKEMEKNGVQWNRGINAPGSRVTRWQILRKRLKASLTWPMEDPGLFCFNTCLQFIRTMPTIQRDPKKPDDIDTKVEDHIADETGYELMESETRTKVVKVSGF